MPLVERFSPCPEGIDINIERFPPKSKDDATLYKLGEAIITEVTANKNYKFADGEEMPLPLKTEEWPSDGWDDGKNSNYRRVWCRVLSDDVHILSKISVIRFYNLQLKEYHTRIETKKHDFISSNLVHDGPDYITKTLKADLNLV